MDLAAGTRLGPYEIIAALGAGGMGEVYRARDTRLDRSVAIKILPSHFSCRIGRRNDAERLQKLPLAVKEALEIVVEITGALGSKMMSVPVQVQPVFQAGRAIEPFDREFDRGAAVNGYAVTPDGQTFVMTSGTESFPSWARFP